MTAVIEPATVDTRITEPGVYDLPDDVYHRDPVPGGSLSASGAKRLLPPSCPALFKHERDNPPPPKPHFDQGHGVHRLVLGVGPEIEVLDYRDWKTNAAKEDAAAARAKGKVPLLAKDYRHVKAMADAIRTDPIAGKLLNPEHGSAERSLFWTDPDTWVQRRARLDFIRDTPGLPFVIVDVKTAVSAAPSAIPRVVDNLRYHVSAAWYIDAVKAVGLCDNPMFIHVFVEKAPPYLVNVVRLDADAERIGRDLCRRALDIYAECAATGVWPGYSNDLTEISLPAYTVRQHDNDPFEGATS